MVTRTPRSSAVAAHVPACHLGGGYPLFNTMGGQLNNATQRRACLAGDLNGLPQMITVIMRHQNNIRPGERSSSPEREDYLQKRDQSGCSHPPKKSAYWNGRAIKWKKTWMPPDACCN